MQERIAGHPGINMYRTDEGILYVVDRKSAETKERYEVCHRAIHTAAEKLKLLEGSGFTPKLIWEKDMSILMEDLGESETVDGWVEEDWKNFRRALVRNLIILRQKHIRHGDLNGNSNIWIKDKKPWFVDWSDSHFIGEKPPQKGPLTDSYWIFTDLIRWIGNPNLSDAYGVSRRWGPINGHLVGSGNCYLPMEGKTLLDVGCNQGDFCAWAAAENMIVTGIDPGGFRSGEDSIAIARELWKGVPNITFHKVDVMEWPTFKYDVILYLRSFVYVAQYHGKEAAINNLRRMVHEVGLIVFFETQIKGDRSAQHVPWLETDEDVQAMVPNAKWTKVVTVPEHGIPRTVWRIEKKKK